MTNTGLRNIYKVHSSSLGGRKGEVQTNYPSTGTDQVFKIKEVLQMPLSGSGYIGKICSSTSEQKVVFLMPVGFLSSMNLLYILQLIDNYRGVIIRWNLTSLNKTITYM